MHKERSQSLDGCEFDDTAQDEEVMAVDTLIQHREQGLCPPDLESLEWDIEITGAQQAELLRVLLDIMQGYHDLGFSEAALRHVLPSLLEDAWDQAELDRPERDAADEPDA